MAFFDTPWVQSLAPVLESAMNAALAVDPASEKRLKPLNGCVLEVNLKSIQQSFFFGVREQRICLLPSETTPSVTLSGSTSGLIKLALSDNKNALFKRREVELSGDAVRAQQIQSFVRELKIDWEALLAEAIGDVPAHMISSGVRSSWNWTRSVSQSLWSDLEEFVKYELRLLPSKALAQKQFEAIDQLRLATDRLEAKFKLLLRKPQHPNKD